MSRGRALFWSVLVPAAASPGTTPVAIELLCRRALEVADILQVDPLLVVERLVGLAEAQRDGIQPYLSPIKGFFHRRPRQRRALLWEGSLRLLLVLGLSAEDERTNDLGLDPTAGGSYIRVCLCCGRKRHQQRSGASVLHAAASVYSVCTVRLTRVFWTPVSGI